MHLFKKTAMAAAMSVLSLSAFAMTPIADEGLSQVAGQDGVSIAANLNINIGSFTYTDTDVGNATTGLGGGGSISFNNIGVHGLIAGTLDIINQATFETILTGVGVQFPTSFYNGGDVVQMAVPATITVPTAALVDVTVDSIRMGNNAASFGRIALTDIDLRGTTAWIWAH